MDELYGDILALLPRLREAGRAQDARHILEALTDVCNPREVLDNLRGALGDLPDDLPTEAQALKTAAEARIDALWQEWGRL